LYIKCKRQEFRLQIHQPLRSMKNFLVRLTLLAGLIFSEKLMAAGDEPDLRGMVSGSNVIYMDYKSDGKNNSTDLTFTTHDASLKQTGSVVITVKGIAGKFCNAVPYYAPDNTNELIAIQVTMREKLFAKTGTVVRITPDFKIQCQYACDNSNAKMGIEMDDAFFAGATVPCMPFDHSLYSMPLIQNLYAEQDAYSDEGGLLYLRHKINAENERALTLKYDEKINSGMYYYKPVDGVIKKTWTFDIEEERILGYKIYVFGNIGYLFTTSLEGKKQNQGAENFQSRMRMFDVQTGEVYWTVLIPEKEGYEYFVSAMTVDLNTGNVYVAMNVLVTEDKINERSGQSRTTFVIARIDKEGNCATQDQELTWPESDVSHTSAPLWLIRNIAVLRNGNIQVAGVFAYWRKGPVMSAEEQEILGPQLAFSIMGLQVSVLAADMKPIETKQYVLPEGKVKDPLVMYSMIGNPRFIIMGSNTHNANGGSKCYWNPETETLILLQLSPNRDEASKKRDYYALKVVGGKEKFFDRVGSGEAPDAHHVVYRCVGYLLNETTLYYASDLNGAKDEKRFDIPN